MTTGNLALYFTCHERSHFLTAIRKPDTVHEGPALRPINSVKINFLEFFARSVQPRE